MNIAQTTASAAPPPQPAVPSARIAVLLASYNGADCLEAQLSSIAAQLRRPDLLLISDDGSTDATRDIVQGFIGAHPGFDIRLLEGPRKGAARNFLSLIARTPEDIDIVAFSDQDDVWLPGKLERGYAALRRAGHSEGPVLYCARTWECRADLSHRRLSRMPRRGTGFRNALVQNVASGNTTMLNRAALALVRQGAGEARRVVVHDWWLYQIVTGAGGRVIYDRAPVLLYRQHKGNLIGANRGLRAQWMRLRMMWRGELRLWNTVNIRALSASAEHLTSENAALLREFARVRRCSARRRLSLIVRRGLYRQGAVGQASLYVAALFGKL